MVVIRLARGGSHKNPFYHVVVADRRFSRDGRFIERVGFYNPMARGNEQRLELVEASITSWIAKGAQPSERVQHLIDAYRKNSEQAKKAVLQTKAEIKREQAAAAQKAAKKKAAEKPAEESTDSAAE